MKKFRLISTLVFSLVLLLAPVCVLKVAAEEKYQVYINDEADLLTDEEEKMLYKDMSGLTEYGNMMFTTVILSTTNYDFNARDAYYKKFGNEPGVNFQIDMGNRKLTLCASTEMENLIGKERESIVSNIYRDASSGDYYSCAKECFHEVYQVVHDERIAHSMKYINNAIIAIIIGLIINYLIIFTSFRGNVATAHIAGLAVSTVMINNLLMREGLLSKKYSPRDRDSSGGGGGGFSGGGGGGGGFSGGSSSHGF